MVDPVTGDKFRVDAINVDGQSNAFRNNGDRLTFCYDGASSGSPAVLTTAVKADRPWLKTNADETSIAFAGINQMFTIPASLTSFNFIHQLGVFDLFLAWRNRGLSSISQGVVNTGESTRSIFGNVGGDTDKGIEVNIVHDGTINIALGNATPSYACIVSSVETTFPNLVPAMLLVRGTGTQIQLSRNFFDFEKFDITGPLASGNATALYTLGTSGVTRQRPAAMLEGDLFWASLYSTNLNQSDLNQMANCIHSRAGDQA